MDIAALSTALSAVDTQSTYGVAVLGKSLDQAETTGQQLVEMLDTGAMERSVYPHIGGNFDMSV